MESRGSPSHPLSITWCKRDRPWRRMEWKEWKVLGEKMSDSIGGKINDRRRDRQQTHLSIVTQTLSISSLAPVCNITFIAQRKSYKNIKSCGPDDACILWCNNIKQRGSTTSGGAVAGIASTVSPKSLCCCWMLGDISSNRYLEAPRDHDCSFLRVLLRSFSLFFNLS